MGESRYEEQGHLDTSHREHKNQIEGFGVAKLVKPRSVCLNMKDFLSSHSQWHYLSAMHKSVKRIS